MSPLHYANQRGLTESIITSLGARVDFLEKKNALLEEKNSNLKNQVEELEGKFVGKYTTLINNQRKRQHEIGNKEEDNKRQRSL
jgi:hypothetical protein